jgi:hypothetical protein
VHDHDRRANPRLQEMDSMAVGHIEKSAGHRLSGQHAFVRLPDNQQNKFVAPWFATDYSSEASRCGAAGVRIGRAVHTGKCLTTCFASCVSNRSD